MSRGRARDSKGIFPAMKPLRLTRKSSIELVRAINLAVDEIQRKADKRKDRQGAVARGGRRVDRRRSTG